MRLRNRTLVMIICILVLLNCSMFSTLAWMTDTSEVVNTFTVGKVEIDLNETDVDEDGDTKKNEYKLIPGSELEKDPALTVIKGSEESYIRMIVNVYNASAVKAVLANERHGLDSFVDMLGGLDKEKWVLEGITEDKSENMLSYEFRYNTTVSGFDAEGKELTEDVTLTPLFTKLLVPGTLTMDELNALENGGFKIVVEGHAIQQMGFENDDEAWAAFKEEEEAEGATDAE